MASFLGFSACLMASGECSRLGWQGVCLWGFWLNKGDKEAFKSLDKLTGSQITDKSRKGVGFESYNVVPPPPTRLFLPPNIDLSYSGLEEFQQPEFKIYGPKSCKIEFKNASEIILNELKESTKFKESYDVPLVKKLVSDDKLENKTIVPTDAKIEFVKAKQQEKPVRKPVKYAEMYRSQGPRGNQRNWNNLKSQQLGSNFVMYNKACFVCRSFEHVQANCNYHQRERGVSRNNYTRVNYNNFTRKTYPNTHRNMAPREVLVKTGLRPLNTARPVNTAHPKTTVQCARPMPRPVNIARPNSSVVNAVRENQVNAVKASTCWVWRPTKPNSASVTLKKHNYIDVRGSNAVIIERIDEHSKTERVNLLVPSCFVIFDLEPLSLSFDFVFSSEIFKSLSFCLNRLLPPCDLVS
nr:retrotransposon Orf1 [Tanacetum cinerariifolium]